MTDAATCWECGETPVAREGLLCDECDERGARIANGSLAADREDERDRCDYEAFGG